MKRNKLLHGLLECSSTAHQTFGRCQRAVHEINLPAPAFCVGLFPTWSDSYPAGKNLSVPRCNGRPVNNPWMDTEPYRYFWFYALADPLSLARPL